MTQPGELLGVNLNLAPAEAAASAIARSCVKCWFGSNPGGTHNWGDCSGFVKAVQTDLWLMPFKGKANSIYDELGERSDWVIFGSGADALAYAGHAANMGSLTIGVWKNSDPNSNGHVAIITAYLPMLGSKPEQHAIGAWGELHGVGQLLGRISQSFGATKHQQIRYAYCVTPIMT
jgi:hypothetical protein